MEFSFFSGLGCPKFFFLYLQTAFIGLKRAADKGWRRAHYVQLAGTCIPACGLQGLLGHPSNFFAAWFVPGGCCDPQNVTAWASPHLERRCPFGLKWFKHFNKFGVTQVVEFFTALFSPKSSSAPAAGSALIVLLVLGGAEVVVEDLGSLRCSLV